MSTMNNKNEGSVFNIQRFSIHDGPGIRTIVFFKGCPLRCLWCCNPESQCLHEEVFFIRKKCIGCGECIKACPTGAIHSIHDENSLLDTSLCTNCGACAKSCPSRALMMKGSSVSLDDVMKVVRKDVDYYRNSGGGVTLSGGEAAMQWEFATTLLKQCHAEGLHTAVETCGFADWQGLKQMAEHTDLFLYDIKHMDSAKHKELAGQPNEIILENARNIDAMGIEMVIRVPVIWGYNDSEENIATIAEFAKSLSQKPKVELLPFHRGGESKYIALNRSYELADIEIPEDGRIEQLRELVQNILES